MNFWSGDPTSECIHALVQQPRVLFLQVDRFEVSAGRVHKRLDEVEANRRLAMPVFSTVDLTIIVTWYELIAIISHHGPAEFSPDPVCSNPARRASTSPTCSSEKSLGKRRVSRPVTLWLR